MGRSSIEPKQFLIGESPGPIATLLFFSNSTYFQLQIALNSAFFFLPVKTKTFPVKKHKFLPVKKKLAREKNWKKMPVKKKDCP